jgi:hypothetical protein
MTMKNDGWSISIPHDVHQKVMFWVMTAEKHEVSGFGTVRIDRKEKVFFVEDAFLLDQENTAGETDIDAIALSKLMFQQKDKGDLKWWWHSHVMMSCFWSGIDMDTIKKLGANGWLLATVFNQKWEKRSAFYTHATSVLGGQELFMDEMETHIQSYYPTDVIDGWAKEYKEKVKEKKYVASKKKKGKGTIYVPGYDDFDWDDYPIHRSQEGSIYDAASDLYANDPDWIWVKGHMSEENKWEPGRWYLKRAVVRLVRENKSMADAMDDDDIKELLEWAKGQGPEQLALTGGKK